MQGFSTFYDTPEQLELMKSLANFPGFDFTKITENTADVLVTASNVNGFKQLLKENIMNYTVTIENVQEAVTEEYITQQVERRLRGRLQAYNTPGKLSFTYYPNNKEVSNTFDSRTG